MGVDECEFVALADDDEVRVTDDEPDDVDDASAVGVDDEVVHADGVDVEDAVRDFHEVTLAEAEMVAVREFR